jgi:hypothetical protein
MLKGCLIARLNAAANFNPISINSSPAFYSIACLLPATTTRKKLKQLFFVCTQIGNAGCKKSLGEDEFLGEFKCGQNS